MGEMVLFSWKTKKVVCNNVKTRHSLLNSQGMGPACRPGDYWFQQVSEGSRWCRGCAGFLGALILRMLGRRRHPPALVERLSPISIPYPSHRQMGWAWDSFGISVQIGVLRSLCLGLLGSIAWKDENHSRTTETEAFIFPIPYQSHVNPISSHINPMHNVANPTFWDSIP